MNTWVTKHEIKIIRLIGLRCNVYIVQFDGQNWMIDTSTFSDKNRILTQMQAERINKLNGIILTHSHINHVEAVSWYASNFDCPVYVHDSELHFVQTGDCLIPKAAKKSLTWVEVLVGYIPFLNRYPACKAAKALPKDGEVMNNPYISIIETPGHSEGSVSIIVDDEIAIVGDVMRRKSVSGVDLRWANQPGLVEVSWRKLLNEACHTFLPAHGIEISRNIIVREIEKAS